VTGGAGFVGSHLCERLLEAGHAVVCLDDLSTGSARNLAHLLGRPGFSFIRQDVATPFDVEVDQIYNLACPASPPLYQLDPIRTFKTNVFGALNVLDLAERTGARVLQASTSEVYGDPEVHPQSESYWGRVNSFGPRSCYDEGKRAAETLFHDYRERRGVDIRVARIFNTYGPRMDPADGRVVSNFVVQALRGQDITVYGDGSQTRSFCYVDDLVEGLVRLMGASRPLHAPINLGNTDEIAVLELAELVIAASGSRSRIVRRPLPTDDPRQRRPDIGRARAELGWEPAIPLAAGLKQTIAYFDGVLDSLDTANRVS
jgi:UDP-glucuronate decarboxylase